MPILKKLHLKTKLTLLASLGVAGLVIFGTITWQTLERVKVNGPYYQRIVQGKDVIADVLPPPEYIIETYLVVLQMLNTTDPAELAQLAERTEALRTDYDTRHAFWQESLPEDKLKEILITTSFTPAMDFFTIVKKKFVPLVLQGEREKAVMLAQGTLKQSYNAHRAAIDEVVKLATASNIEEEQQATDTIAARTLALVLTGLGLTVSLVLLGWRVAKDIIVPLRNTIPTLQAVAEGNLTRRLEVTTADEVGQMASALNQSLQSLSSTMAQIDQNAQTVASASEELTNVSQQMSTDAEETSAQAGVVSAAGEQVNKNVQTVAAGSEEISASIKEIAKNASEAARMASQAVRVAQTTNNTITQLGTSSREISNVIKVITSIAEQTNLLALNATIEAARAGEAGKGFAVVANEVKELAKQTAEATEDISRKIGAIQNDTQEAVTAVEQISEVINQINDIANTIASAVEEQSVTTAEVARNVEEASKGSYEIARNITGVARAAQSTTSGATQTQASAQKLSRLAAELQQLVGQFKYDEERNGLAPTRKAMVGVRSTVNGHEQEVVHF